MSQEESHPQTASAALPVYNIVGDKVALGPGTKAEIVELFYRGDNDFEVTLLAGDPLAPRAREAFEADYDRDAKEPHPHWIGFIIFDRATATPIGGLGIRDIDFTKGIAELGISIGRKDYWGKGFGTEAISLMLDYSFTVLGLHNIQLSTYAYNERAMRSYLKVGFREIGRRRQAQRIGAKRYDVVYMDILSEEFHSAFKPVVQAP